MSRLSIVVSVLLKILGLLVISAAVFLYEDEEGHLQSRIEELWIRITDKRSAALSRSAAFIRESARWMRKAFDRIYGVRFVSLRIVAVSIWFSLASIYMLGFLNYGDHALHFAHPFPVGMLVRFMGCVALGLVPAVAPNRWVIALWYVSLIRIFVPIVPFAVFVYQKKPDLAIHALGFISVGLGVSFVFNILYIAAMRWVLKKISNSSTNSQIYHGIVAMVVFVLLALFLLFGPILLGLSLIKSYHPASTGSLAGWAGVAALFSVVLNSVSLVTCLLGVLFSVTMLVHRLFWPLIQRPLYALQRYGVVSRKRSLWALGISLVVLTPPQLSWRLLLDALEKLKSF